MRGLAAGLAIVMFTLGAGSSFAQKAALPDVLAAAAAYVAQYSDRLQAVGAEEDYLQLEVSPGSIRLTRRLLSDVVFAGLGLGRVAFYRDVLSKDGNLVRERHPRLLSLFQTPVGEPLERAQQLTDEGVRHDVSKNLKLFNEILGPLALLRHENHTRATFKLDGVRTTGGTEVATLTFKESATPHLINSPIDDPATGRFLVDVKTGAVRRTELAISNQHVNLRVTVVYAPEPALGLWLPSTMTLQGDISTVGAGGTTRNSAEAYDVRESLEGRATYSKFQQVPITFKVR